MTKTTKRKHGTGRYDYEGWSDTAIRAEALKLAARRAHKAGRWAKAHWLYKASKRTDSVDGQRILRSL